MVPVVGQIAGALLLLAGVYLLAGVGWALTAAGAGLLAVGVLSEMRRPAGTSGERYTS